MSLPGLTNSYKQYAQANSIFGNPIPGIDAGSSTQPAQFGMKMRDSSSSGFGGLGRHNNF